MSIRKVNATPNGTRMMWKPRVKAIICRAGSSWAGSAASRRSLPAATRAMRSSSSGGTGPASQDAGAPRPPSAVDDGGDEVALLEDLALGDVQVLHGAGPLGEDGDLHLHRLEDDEWVAGGD